MPKRRLTLADAALARHMREEAARTTAEQAESRQFRVYVGVILVAVIAFAMVVAWAFFDVGASTLNGS